MTDTGEPTPSMRDGAAVEAQWETGRNPCQLSRLTRWPQVAQKVASKSTQLDYHLQRVIARRSESTLPTYPLRQENVDMTRSGY